MLYDLHSILLRCSGNVSNIFTPGERRLIRALFINEPTLNIKNWKFCIQFIVILLFISSANSQSAQVDKNAYNKSLQSIYYKTFNRKLPEPILDSLNLNINQIPSLSKEMKFITKLKHRYKRNNTVKVQNESLERPDELDNGRKVVNSTNTNTGINICEKWGTCSQLCVSLDNSNGSYECGCEKGYQLQQDKFSCVSIDSKPAVLLITSAEGLIRTSLDGDEELLTDHSHHGALDYLYLKDESLMFWSDVYEDKIYSGSFDGSSVKNVKPIVEGNVESVEGIAVDWIRWHIYWVESHYQHIELASFDGSFRTSLMSDLIRPRAIALDPEISFLFWTDWEKEKPRIERSDLSGQNRRVLVDINYIERGGWPNGLTLDRILQVVYWVDGKSGILHAVRYDGNNHRMVYKNELSRHPMSLALFGNYVYWTDKKEHTVTQINRWSRKEMKTLLLKEHSIYDIKVFHSSLQPGMADPCQLGNNGCSHICVLNSGRKPTCVCPYGMLLSSDEKTCKKPAYLLVYFCSESNGTKNIIGIKDLNISSTKWLYPPISLGNNQIIPKSRIAVHPGTDTIFWAEGNSLWKQEFSGKAKKLLQLAQRQILSVTVHSPSQNLYLSSMVDDKDGNVTYYISVCSVEGEFFTDIMAKDLCRVSVLKTDDLNVRLLWLHVCSKSAGATDLYILESSLLDGSQREVLFQSEEEILEDLSLTEENTKRCLIFASNMSVVCSLSNVTWMIEANLSTSSKKPITSFALQGNHVFFTSNSNAYDIWLTKTLASVSWPVFSVDVISTSKERNICQESNCSGLCIPISKRKIQCNQISREGVKSFLMLDEQRSLRGVPINNNNLSELSSPSTMFPVYLFTPQEDTKVDVWWHNNTIYWSNNTAGGLFSVQLDGSSRRRVAMIKGNTTSLRVDWISAQRQILSVTVHSPSQNLYLSSMVDDKDGNVSYYISVCSVEGEFFTDIVAKDLCRVSVLKTDDRNVRLLWLHVCSKSAGATDLYILESSLLDGSQREVLFQSEEEILEDLSLTEENTKRCLIFASNMSVVCSLSNVTWMIEANLSTSSKKPITSFALQGNHVFFTSNSNAYDIWLTKTLASVSWPVFSVDVISTSKVSVERNICQESNCSGLCIPISKRKIQCNQISREGVKSFLMLDEQRSLRGVPINNNNLSELSSPSTMFPVYLFTPQEDTKVDVWWHNNTIYWSNNTAGGLFSVQLDGSSRRRVAMIKGNITSLGVDWISGNLYYGRKKPTGAVIEVLCPHSNVSPYIVINQNLENPSSICIHPLKGYLFWTDVYGGSKIERSLLSGKQRITITSKNYKIGDIALDVIENVFYWCDPVTRVIIRSNLEGLNQEVFLESGRHFPLSVAVSSIYLFWTDRHNDEERIFKSFKNGSGDEIELFNNTNIKLLHVFDREQQNGSNICSYRNGGCQHLCFYEGHKHHNCACVYSKLGLDGRSCEDYTQFILLTNGNTIESLSLEDSTNPNPPVPPIVPFVEALELVALAYDSTHDMIYFAETKQGKGIFQVKKDGSDLKHLVHGGLLHIQGLAYDSKDGVLYFTESIDPSICQLIIDAGVPSKCIIHLGYSDVPHGIVVDSCGRTIYWSNWKETGSLIESISVNGSNHHSVITSNLQHPTDISLDHEASMLYWVDVHIDGTYYIERSSTKGLRRQVIEEGYGHGPFGITVFGDYLFSTMRDQILRSDKNSGNNKIVLHSGMKKPMDLVVVSSTYPKCTLSTLSNTLQNLNNNCNGTKCWKDSQNVANSTIADTVELTTLYLVLVILGILCFLMLLTLLLYYRKRKKYFEESSSGFENQLSNCSQENSVCSETVGEDTSMNSLLSEKDLTYVYLHFTKCPRKTQLLLQNNKEFISDTLL